MRLCYDQCWTGRSVIVRHGKNFNVAIFSDTTNVINVKLCMMILLTELYPLIPLQMTLSIFQGHSSVKQFLTEICIFFSE